LLRIRRATIGAGTADDIALLVVFVFGRGFFGKHGGETLPLALLGLEALQCFAILRIHRFLEDRVEVRFGLVEAGLRLCVVGMLLQVVGGVDHLLFRLRQLLLQLLRHHSRIQTLHVAIRSDALPLGDECSTVRRCL
jgi:hypothetical protein